MAWLRDEVWFETDVLWFREQPRRPFVPQALESAFAVDAFDASLLGPVANGLEASRRRRLAAKSARRRRHATRTMPAVALVLGSATMLPIAAIRHSSGGGSGPLQEDPPSLSFRLDVGRLGVSEPPFLRDGAPRKVVVPTPKPTRASELASVRWHRATSVGLPYGGHLVNGTQLPVHGPDWVTWDPSRTASRTSRTGSMATSTRLNDHLRLPGVPFRQPDCAAPRRRRHQLSERRHDGRARLTPERARRRHLLPAARQAPERADRHEPDRPSSGQDLLNRFVAAGAQMVFVGYFDGPPRPTGSRDPVPEPREPRARPLFAAAGLTPLPGGAVIEISIGLEQHPRVSPPAGLAESARPRQRLLRRQRRRRPALHHTVVRG